MAQRRRGDRGASTLIWPGFVDAMTALLLVLMFVLSIFMIVQFVLSEELVGKDRSLQNLTAQLGALTSQLSLAEQEAEFYEAELQSLSGLLDEERARAGELASALQSRTEEAEQLTAEVAAQVLEIAALSSSLEASQGEVDELQALMAALAEERNTAVAELDAALLVNAEAAGLAERNEALKNEVAALIVARDEAAAALNAAESTISAREAALAAVRKRLAERNAEASQSELTLGERIAALELALDQKRAEAEQTLLLLAAIEAKHDELDAALQAREEQASRAEIEIERLQALAAETGETATRRELAASFARATLQAERELSSQSRQAVALLNTQVRQLRNEISGLRLQLDAAEERDAENEVIIQDLGARLNQALAQKVGELQRYRSEFFGRMREILGDRQDIRIVGDRFVFQSEVLFGTGRAELGAGGREQLSSLAAAIREIQNEIPGDVNWLLRIDGHTDRVPISGFGRFRNNWELSQARALSVVEFLINVEGLPSDRLAAAGFGEYHPLDDRDTPEAYARNRRIEMRLTER